MSNYNSQLQLNNEALSSNNTDLQSIIDQAIVFDAEINTQANLIEQIQTAVDGLPNASGGGIETCTVSVSRDEDYTILGVRVEDGIPVPFYSEDVNKTETWETICGSVVVISSPWTLGYNCSNATFIGDNLNYTSNSTLSHSTSVKIFRIDAKAGETAIIDVYEVMYGG